MQVCLQHKLRPLLVVLMKWMALFQVIPFPTSCDTLEDCACRDPNAQENNKGIRHRTLG